MSSLIACDEELIRRLPLPLAQLYRRAHNAKTPLERHLTAFYLWEASLKLLASVAVVEYASQFRLGELSATGVDKCKGIVVVGGKERNLPCGSRLVARSLGLLRAVAVRVDQDDALAAAEHHRMRCRPDVARAVGAVVRLPV